MKISEISCTILEDGTLKVETGDLEGSNHFSADQLMEALADMLGGEVDIKNRTRVAMHSNLQGALHVHSQDGHMHTH